MATERDPSPAREALASRLATAAEVLLGKRAPAPAAERALTSSVLLDALVARVQESRSHDEAWLLFTAVASAFPTAMELRDLRRTLDLEDRFDATRSLLAAAGAVLASRGTPDLPMRLVRAGAVIDVDYSARHALNSGVQRVVRNVIPRWVDDHDVELVAWTRTGGAYRTLQEAERQHVVAWVGVEHDLGRPDTDGAELVVPYGATLVLPEVPGPHASEVLRGLAELTSTPVAVIGYDCIPIVSADLLPDVEPEKFARFLALVKHTDVVASISASAGAEFAGFTAMLGGQGLPGPEVVVCGLPTSLGSLVDARTDDATSDGAPAVDDTPPAPAVAAPLPSGPPRVACVGSFDARKNQVALLHAAARLWREGRDFSLELVGAGGSSEQTRAEIAVLVAEGRPVEHRQNVGDDELNEVYRRARFTVFPSLHEGYGLPISESLSHGTPVISSDFGSTAEIAADGGVLLVDPRDDDALLDAMRRMLDDDALVAELAAQIADRPVRTWADYAAELWQALVERPGRHDAGGER